MLTSYHTCLKKLSVHAPKSILFLMLLLLVTNFRGFSPPLKSPIIKSRRSGQIHKAPAPINIIPLGRGECHVTYVTD